MQYTNYGTGSAFELPTQSGTYGITTSLCGEIPTLALNYISTATRQCREFPVVMAASVISSSFTTSYY